MKKTYVLFAVLLALLTVGNAWGGDGERAGTRWMLTLEHGPLKIVPFTGGAGQPVAYHYMTLKVTNPGTLPRDWFPLAKALTDTNKTYVAMGFDEALEAVRAKEGNDQLAPIGASRGKIAAGETLDTVAIFGPLDPLYDRVRVQLLGLSDPIGIYKLDKYAVPVELADDVAYFQADGDGGYEKITDGVLIQDVAYLERNAMVRKLMLKELGEGKLPDPTSEYWEVKERRVFEMIYTRPGDEFRPDDDLISFEREHWIIVGDVKALRQIKM
jgi:hypothetical protein